MATIELPDGISEEMGKQWMARMYSSYKQAQVNQTPEYIAKVEQVRVDIDAYLTKVGLPTQFKKAVKE
jgi:hypothetical protein